MHNPLLWLGLSLFLVAVCLVAVLLVAIPVIQELSRTARSAEKLLDMLSRELPPTLKSLRSTGDDLSELSGQVNEGVRSASQVVTQVDHGLETVRSQAENVTRGGISLLTGLRAAWQQWRDPDTDLYYEDPSLYEDFDSSEEPGVESAKDSDGEEEIKISNGAQPQAHPEPSLEVTHNASTPTVNSLETVKPQETRSVADLRSPNPIEVRSPSTSDAPRQTVDEQV